MARTTADGMHSDDDRAAQRHADPVRAPAAITADPPGGFDAQTRAALIDLLAQARESGEIEDASGQRRYCRYAFHPRVEVRHLDQDEESAQLGSLRDVSCGGIALWAPIAAQPGDLLAVRIWPRNHRPVWVNVTVAHCQEGRGGLLIGARFPEVLPAPEAVGGSPATANDPPPNAAASTAATSRPSPRPAAIRSPRRETIEPPPPEEVDAEVIAALLDLLQEAREAGDVDAWPGKRGALRYSFSPRLEVAREGERETVLNATLHNISRCGMAFWSRVAFLPGSFIHVRVWPPNRPATWVPVRVEHCERGLRGFLIGASFPVQLPAEVQQAIEHPPQEPAPVEASNTHWYAWIALALLTGVILARLF